MITRASFQVTLSDPAVFCQRCETPLLLQCIGRRGPARSAGHARGARAILTWAVANDPAKGPPQFLSWPRFPGRCPVSGQVSGICRTHWALV